MATGKQSGKASSVPFKTDDLDEDDAIEFDGKLPPLPAAFGGEKLEAVATGFPPYLEPKKGLVVDVIPRMLDFTNPKFIRVVAEYIGDEPLTCYTGPKDDDGDAAEVIVHKGQFITIGWYATLPLEFALKDEVPVRIVCLKQSKSEKDGEVRKLWHWSYLCTAKGKEHILREKARAMAFGARDPKTNPKYLLAFTPDGMKLSAPTEQMLMLDEKATSRRAANAEA